MKYIILFFLLFSTPAFAEKFVTSHPSRSLNSVFMPNARYYTLVRYTIKIVSTASLVGGQSGAVELRSDSAVAPTEIQDEAESSFVITLGVGIGWTFTSEWTVSYVVPPGHNVIIATSGGATITLSRVTEQTIYPSFDIINWTTGFPYY